MQGVELLAPARNAEVGIEAFNHGADAVYIGSPAFSARAAAGNSVQDIERLASYGHRFGAKTIVALNTILTDAELPEAERLSWQLYEAGVDALIIQDLGLLQLDLPPMELHASTQTDNRTTEKVRLMRDLGMTRVVLARELSIDQIKAIHEAVPDVELECFVHGALCVCISGQCYMSAALTGRSANRGECAQPCRLPMDLIMPGKAFGHDGSARGDQVLARQRHLLSLRDMNRSAYVAQLIEAGVTSLKIEGRLKDASYVKNVVAYYRRLIDQTGCQRASLGRCTYTFEPKLEKSFNRGFTSYFAEGKREPMWNFESPKAMGEKIGVVDEVMRDSFRVKLEADIALQNGDGLAVGAMGFRLNRYEPSTHVCFPLEGNKVCPQLKPGMTVWRNLDVAFERLLSRPSARRTMTVDMQFRASTQSLWLKMRLAEVEGVEAEVMTEGQYEPAQKPQTENIIRQLSKLGDSLYCAGNISVEGDEWFVPSSQLSDLRRRACEQLMEAWLKVQTTLRTSYQKPDYKKLSAAVDGREVLPTDYMANVMNNMARKTYAGMQINYVEDAFEKQNNKEGMVMQTRHCLKYAFGQCPRYSNPHPEKLLSNDVKLGSEALLKIGNKKFILKFGCKNDCISEIFTIFAANKETER